MKTTIRVLALLFASSLMAADKPVPLILETDIGGDVDDAYALVLAARSPQVNLLAVVTAHGNVALRSAVARKLLLLMGQDQVPVASGPEMPLDGRQPFRADWEGIGVISPGEKVSGVSPLPAPELMAQVVKASKEKVVIVSVGGLSTSALFLQKYPELRAKIARFVIMGGCVRPFELEGKRMPPRLETNLHHDIKASEIVLNSGIPITLVPIEVTVHAKLYYPDFDRIQASPSPLAQAITAHTRDWSARMKAIMKTLGVEAFLADTVVWLHDPLAVCVLVDPRVARVERQKIRVETSPGDIRTIADPQGPLTIDLVTSVDSHRLSRLVTDRILQK